MSKVHQIAVLAGDGIGPEIVTQAVKVLDALRGADFDFLSKTALVGAAALDVHGEPLPEASVTIAKSSDAVLFGAVGDPRFDAFEASKRPERAILGLRRELGLFAALKRVTVSANLAHLSPLRSDLIAGTDLLVVRELNGDVYTGQPKGERTSPDGPFAGQREGYDTMRYAEGEIRRIAHVAFNASQSRSGRVCSVDKANVLATSRLWREIVTDVAKEYPNVELSHMYADNAAMQLVTAPTRFDTLLTANLFGDVLTDVASVLTGSIGLPASALLGDSNLGMYEAGHGTALDIAGQDLANPLACIRAAALMLRYSLKREDLATRIETAVDQVLKAGLRTQDLPGGLSPIGTDAMGDAVVQAMLNQTQG